MRAHHRGMAPLAVVAALLLAACDNNNGSSGSIGNGGQSAGLAAVISTANQSTCESFTPTPINGQSFPQDDGGGVPTVLNGSPSPLNC